MKPSIDKVRDAMGELMYAVAMVDGAVQPVEVDKLKELLLAHPWASQIQWSFDYEKDRANDVEEAYLKAMDTFKAYGPSPEYAFLFEVLDAIAKAHDGVAYGEMEIIDRFKRELKEHFINATD